MSALKNWFMNLDPVSVCILGVVIVIIAGVIKLVHDEFVMSRNEWYPTGMLAPSHSNGNDSEYNDDEYDDYYDEDDYNTRVQIHSNLVTDTTVNDYEFFHALNVPSNSNDYDRARDYYGSDEYTIIKQRYVSDAVTTYQHHNFQESDGIFVTVAAPYVPDLFSDVNTTNANTRVFDATIIETRPMIAQPVPTFGDDLDYLLNGNGRHTRFTSSNVIDAPVSPAPMSSEYIGRHSLVVAPGTAAQRALAGQTGQFDIIQRELVLV